MYHNLIYSNVQCVKDANRKTLKPLTYTLAILIHSDITQPYICHILSFVRFWIITSCPYLIIWEVLLAITR